MKYALTLALLLAASPALSAEVSAVASFSILGDLVQQVGGERVAVTTIVGPNADSHVYEPKPSDAVAVAGADIFFVNGLGFEGWMDRFVQATGYAGALVTVSDGIAAQEMAEEDGHDHHAEGEHEATDPHAWQNLQNGVLYVENIAKGLCAVDADGCAGYTANAAAYAAQLTALDADVKTRIAAIPEVRRKVITTHDAFGYFGAAYGVTFLAPEGISTDAEPSAAAVARLVTQIRAEGVSALFIENMSDGRLVQQIAQETGITPGGELYADALSPADGPAATYLDMFRHNVGLLIPAMEGQ
ncbi:MAG: metal ABC transporter substrate-binding protein [Hyphomicrobiales bacterium]|nr:MAG: metal ABC transporter substrate-binding protein [Hyphomicrobiales bacterium]